MALADSYTGNEDLIEKLVAVNRVFCGLGSSREEEKNMVEVADANAHESADA